MARLMAERRADPTADPNVLLNPRGYQFFEHAISAGLSAREFDQFMCKEVRNTRALPQPVGVALSAVLAHT